MRILTVPAQLALLATLLGLPAGTATATRRRGCMTVATDYRGTTFEEDSERSTTHRVMVAGFERLTSLVADGDAICTFDGVEALRVYESDCS